MSGWCMCNAIAKALLISPNPFAPCGRNTGSVRLARIACLMRSSEPQMLGSPSTHSARSAMVTLLFEEHQALLHAHPDRLPPAHLVPGAERDGSCQSVVLSDPP